MESMQPEKSSKSNRGYLIGGVALALLIGYLIWNLQKTKAQHISEIQDLLQKNQTEINVLDTRRLAELDSLNRLRLFETDSITETANKTMSLMEEKHKKDIKAKQAQIFQILRNSELVDRQLDTLRQKIITSNQLTQADLNGMDGIIDGLKFLAEQYKKPIEQFEDLERYVVQGLERENLILPPSQRFALLKRMFSSKYNQGLADYYQSVGRRDAFIKTRDKIQEAYRSAQADIAKADEQMSKSIAAITKTGGNSEAGISEAVNAIDAARHVLNVHAIFTSKPEEMKSIPLKTKKE